MQLTTVLKHLARLRPNWNVDVAARLGTHSAFRDLCRRIFILDCDPVDPGAYGRVFNLAWPECPMCFADSPSTKVEWCLQQTFSVKPHAELLRYEVQPNVEDRELVREYLEGNVGTLQTDRQRYPIVLIHYEGESSPATKNLSVSLVALLCDEICHNSAIPMILDWSHRSPLPDGKRVFNPHVELELWRGYRTGDAGVLAALINRAALFIGIDSGPLHVAAATETPSLAVWTGHHPVHYLCPADHILHLVPRNHVCLLRGDHDAGIHYFEENYRHEVYSDLHDSITAWLRFQLRDFGTNRSPPATKCTPS